MGLNAGVTCVTSRRALTVDVLGVVIDDTCSLSPGECSETQRPQTRRSSQNECRWVAHSGYNLITPPPVLGRLKSRIACMIGGKPLNRLRADHDRLEFQLLVE